MSNPATSPTSPASSSPTEDNGGEDRYLIFQIGSESFAAPLLSIREIVEPLSYRPTPSPYDYLLGLANLRGQIVGILDLGKRLGIAPIADQKAAASLVFDVDGTSLAGFVNRVESVTAIPATAIDKECHVETSIPEAALRGIGKVDSRLIPIIHLPDLI